MSPRFVGNRHVAIWLCVLVPLGVWSLGLLRAPRFMSDDFIFIVDNHATWLSAWARDSYQAVGFEGAPAVVYRPLGVAMLAWLRDTWGTSSPIPYRALAVGLHACNAGLLALWLSRLGLGVRAAAAAAILWSIMPVHAEALGWVVALFDVASSSALLGALVLAGSPRPRGIAALACFLVAVLIKESTLLGAFALWTTLACCPLRIRSWSQLARQGALLAIVCLGYLIARHSVGVSSPAELPLSLGALFTSLGEGFARATGSWLFAPSAGPPLHSPRWLGVGSVVILALLVLSSGFRSPRVVIPVASLGAIAAGQILFGQSQIGFLVDPDRYFYLAASIVPVAAVVLVGSALPARAATKTTSLTLSFLFVAVLAFWSWGSVLALADYDDFEHMLDREIGMGRASGYVHFLRGVERLKRDDPCSAAADFEQSVELEPNAARRQQAQQLATRARDACSRGAI